MSDREKLEQAIKDSWLDSYAYDPSSYEFHVSELECIKNITDKILKDFIPKEKSE